MKKAPPARRRSAPAREARAPTYDDLLAIVRLIESGSRFSEFRLRSGDIEVDIKRANGLPVTPAPDDGARGQAPAGAQSDPGPSSSRTPGKTKELPADAHVIRSPMVGTFYRAREPGAEPFVEIGAHVEPDTVVCIIEVMKLMNSVTAGVSGKVTHIVVENAQMVEFGQPLIAITTQ